MLESVLGKAFEVISSKIILDSPLCAYATSKPDLVFYSKENFVVGNTIVGGVIPMDTDREEMSPPPEPEENTLLGVAGEDKLIKKGETQAIAAMLLVATHLGQRAVIAGTFFNQCIIYGFFREVSVDLATPMKMTIDFTHETTMIVKGKPTNPSMIILTIKDLLMDI